MEQSNNTDEIGINKDSIISDLNARIHKMETERHEMRLAMRMLLKSFINVEKNRDQLRYYEQADMIFKKYHDVTDCLRAGAAPAEQPTIPQQGAVKDEE